MTRRCLDSTCPTPTTTPPGRRSKTRETSPAEEVRQTAVNCLFSNFYSLSFYCQTSTICLYNPSVLKLLWYAFKSFYCHTAKICLVFFLLTNFIICLSEEKLLKCVAILDNRFLKSNCYLHSKEKAFTICKDKLLYFIICLHSK